MSNEEQEQHSGTESQLPGDVLEKIVELSEKGNDYMDEEDLSAAVDVWEDALELIPEPRNQYGESVWLFASIGDAYFLQDDFDTAASYFEQAVGNLEENAYLNPFIMLRLGQSYLENGDEAKAKEFLLRAYLLENKEIFEDEEEKYLDFLRTHVDLNQQP